jgi:hypothetical protein
MSRDEYKNKTSIYMLDKYGLKEMNPTITVRLDFKIYGSLNVSNNTYFWKVEFKTRFGEKAKEQFGLGKFTVDKDFVVKKTVNFVPENQFDDQHPVLFQPQIRKGLIEVLTEMRDKVLSIEPLESINLIKLSPKFTDTDSTFSEPEFAEPDLSEDVLNKLIGDIISEIKN